MCRAFPTEVSCDFPSVGAAGGSQTTNGLCILTQNNINEKIYHVLWFWFVILGIISILHLVFRIATIVSSKLRFYLLYSIVRK